MRATGQIFGLALHQLTMHFIIEKQTLEILRVRAGSSRPLVFP